MKIVFKNFISQFLVIFSVGIIGIFVAFFPSVAEATLSSVVITPINSTIVVGSTQQFVANGIFSDGSAQILGSSETVTAVAAGYFHSCALFSNNKVKCWGYGEYGQLGDGNNIYRSPDPVSISSLSTTTAITVGITHTCALLSDHTIKCWGYNGVGQLGNGTTINSNAPVLVNNISNAIAVSAGQNHTCALLSDRTVKCWGANLDGFLGNGMTVHSSIPVLVNGVSTATAISVGADYACALLLNGDIRCWGSNSFGHLGYGAFSNSLVSGAISGVSSATAISAGSAYACSVISDGSIKCWGKNTNGNLGNGSTINSSIPVPVTGIINAISISTGLNHACALLTNGSVKCWGYNSNGQLGNETIINSSIPVQVRGISAATSVVAGGLHTCVFLVDRTIKCWGNNTYGQLGDGTLVGSTVPISTNIPSGLFWVSSDGAVATIDFNGLVTGVSPGVATVSALINGVSWGTTLTVVQTPISFLSQIKNTPNSWKLRNTPGTKIIGTQTDKPSSDVIKTVPNDWVVKVTSTTDVNGANADIDGYRWYQVEDVTDGATGWMAAKKLVDSTEYLSYDGSDQTLLEAKATTALYQTKEDRTPVVLQAVDTYHTQPNTSSSLYGGGGGYDGLNNFQKFIQGSLFQKEFVLAILAHESAGTLDNEICASARDGGIGIMQLTSTGFKGLGSALKNYPKIDDCRTSFPTSKYYSNALQGIYANIKDGFRTLQEKYRKKCPDAQLTVGTLTYTCQDIERVLTTWGYNGKVLTGNYLRQISDSLRDLAIVFPGVTYANNDQFIEKLKVANANRIEFKKFSPVEIEVVDSQGRVTGFDGTPVIREEIPFSRYDREADGGVVFFPQNPYIYRIIGTGVGTYGFRVEFTQNDILRTFYATNIPVVPGEIHEYLIDWDALDRGERGVMVLIDTDGDGIVDRIVKSDGVLTEIVPPVVTIASPAGEYLLNATTTIQFSVTDTSGIATISATLNGAPVSIEQIVTLTKPGLNTLEVTAMDNEGNEAIATNTFIVLYDTSSFLLPVTSDGSKVYNQGRVLPVKFELRDANGSAVSSALARLYIAKVNNGIIEDDIMPVASSVANIGNYFRYDASSQMYIFNLSTNAMSAGIWQLKAVFDSGQEIRANVLIRSN